MLTNSTVSGNTVGSESGGIHIDSGGTGPHSGAIPTGSSILTLTNSIISGNVAGDSGGGIYSYSSFQASIVILTDSAISGNMASGDGGGFFGECGAGTRCGSSGVTLTVVPSRAIRQEKMVAGFLTMPSISLLSPLSTAPSRVTQLVVAIAVVGF